MNSRKIRKKINNGKILACVAFDNLKPLQGTVRDITDSGICILINSPLDSYRIDKKAQLILFPEDTSGAAKKENIKEQRQIVLDAVLRYITREGTLYRAGFEFSRISADSSPALILAGIPEASESQPQKTVPGDTQTFNSPESPGPGAETLYEPPQASDDIFEKAENFYRNFLRIKNTGHYLYRRMLRSAARNRVFVLEPESGIEREMIMFASNSYLGLSTDPRVVEASIKAAEKYGYGTGSVALMSGTTDLHVELEEKIARFYKSEAAVVFPTGYQANLATIQALVGEKDICLADLYSHASIIDGVTLSRATLKYFEHNNMSSLERLLSKISSRFRGKLIVTDGVFSMDGDICPLDRLHELSQKYGARLLIDEAHALGIIGRTGRGTAEHFGLEGKIDLTVGTLSKAPAGIGGYLVGKRSVVEYVRHFGRGYIFSTSIPAPVIAGLLAIFDILEKDHSLKEKLFANIEYIKKGLHTIGYRTLDSITAIIPVIIPDEQKLRAMCRELHEKGVFVTPVTFPAVPRGRARIRISVMASHTKEDMDYLLNLLEEMYKKYGLSEMK